MLNYEIPWSDISFIILMILMGIVSYMSYRAGKLDGYQEGCKVRRMAERQVRRMR